MGLNSQVWIILDLKIGVKFHELISNKVQLNFYSNVENHALWAWSEFNGFAS
jgi:hypothetical protein